MTNRTLRRSVPMVLAAALTALCACHSDSNENDIKPIVASVSTPDPVPSGPAVYLRVAASDNPSDDVVPIEVVLTPGATLTFDAFNVEILPTDPANPSILRDGIVQMTFDTAMGSTPFGTCNSCVSTGGTCGVCVPCGSCPPTDPATNPVNTPFCFAATSSSRSFLVGVANVVASGCLPETVTTDTVIAVLSVFARTVGSARLRFVVNPNVTGDCEILLQTVVVPGVIFDDRGAVFTAAR
ncbi:MAG TPA: hypothetical protein VFD06_10005 [Candidatus Polarisedimenticolia bacterium]|nr:hypothetical protein [Candidatus Polarisedimenticolia bacterium]